MSSKINVWEIVTGHFETLKSTNNQHSKMDLFTFIFVPVGIAVASGVLGFNLNKDLASLLVNFGAIFTALLLSVLVLVYDQENKVEASRDHGDYLTKKELLRQLYYNISYSILCAVALVICCLLHSMIKGEYAQFEVFKVAVNFKYDVYIVTPAIAFVASNLFLNILMIVKRMHALLITQ